MPFNFTPSLIRATGRTSMVVGITVFIIGKFLLLQLHDTG
jgi:hypothetical protein